MSPFHPNQTLGASVHFRPCLDGAPLASSVCVAAALLGCGHVFDLLMRPFHGPLAMMPCPLMPGSRPIARAWKRRVVSGFSRIVGPAVRQLCVSQSPALANLVGALVP